MVSNADKTFKVTVGNTKGVSSSQAAGVSYGYAQVEPNHLSAQRTGAIYAQLPCKSDIEVLENGQFVKYDYPEGVVDFTGKGEWMLVFNEVKVYHDRDTDADFAMKKFNYIARVYGADNSFMPENTNMVPRVFKTEIGDIFTTNAVQNKIEELKKGDTLTVGEDGFLKKTEGASEGMIWQVAKIYTLGDLQPAVKVQRIQ
jgi:hypothetical protein